MIVPTPRLLPTNASFPRPSLGAHPLSPSPQRVARAISRLRATLGGVGGPITRRHRPHQKVSDGSLGVPSVFLEPNLPKPHIEQLHLWIDEFVSLHSTPHFLEAVVVLLVNIRKFEERVLVITLLF